MNALFPDASFRSPTAVAGKSDLRDESVYSALVVSDGATGQTTLFGVPKGQAIPLLGNGTAQAHQRTYSELTTNITQAGQLGAAIGDASIRKIGITLEQAYYTTSGVINSYGAGLRETCEVLAKCFFQMRIAGKLQIQGPVFSFPSVGHAFGSVATGATAALPGVVNNGWPGSPRALKIPILVGRTDTVEATFGVAGGSTLAFTTSSGNPSLCWVTLHALVKGDAR